MYDHDDPEAAHSAAARTPRTDAGGPARPPAAAPGSTDARPMLELQRLAGNASVSRMLARETAADADGAEPTGGAARSPVLDVVGRGGGEPLPPDIRTDMEGRLGADFGGVRV